MPTRDQPTVLLSEVFYQDWREQLEAVAPAARFVRHAVDGSWQGDPATATVAVMSSDMWFTKMGVQVRDDFADLPAVEWVSSSAVGIDQPVFGRLLARGVLLTNGVGNNSLAVAQHALTLMLARARRLAEFREHQREERYVRIVCDELTEATVLIVGLGGIGRELARLCSALGMRVLAVRRSSAPEPFVDEVQPTAKLLDLLPVVDYVVLACPLTEETRGLIGPAALAAMKPTSYLVNVTRGEVVDTAALLAALRDGTVAGAALDVFDQEPLPAGHPLWTAPNVTITPHAAASSPLTPKRGARLFIDNLGRWVRGEPLRNVVPPTA